MLEELHQAAEFLPYLSYDLPSLMMSTTPPTLPLCFLCSTPMPWVLFASILPHQPIDPLLHATLSNIIKIRNRTKYSIPEPTLEKVYPFSLI